MALRDSPHSNPKCSSILARSLIHLRHKEHRDFPAQLANVDFFCCALSSGAAMLFSLGRERKKSALHPKGTTTLSPANTFGPTSTAGLANPDSFLLDTIGSGASRILRANQSW